MKVWLVRMNLNTDAYDTLLVGGETPAEAFDRARALWVQGGGAIRWQRDERQCTAPFFCYDVWPLDGVTIDRDVNLSAIRGKTVYPNRPGQRLEPDARVTS